MALDTKTENQCDPEVVPRKVILTSAKARWSQEGWGYVVVIGAFFTAFLLDGMEGSYGILMPSLLEDLGGSVSMTSFTGGLITGVALAIGPVISRLIESYGCRRIAFVGSVTIVVSNVIATFSVNMAMFTIFYGVFCGLGVGMVYMSYITIVNMYFDENRSIAVGFVTSGSGFGLLTMAFGISNLMTCYGWRGCYIIVAAIMAHLCVIACIMRPLKPLETTSTTTSITITTMITRHDEKKITEIVQKCPCPEEKEKGEEEEEEEEECPPMETTLKMYDRKSTQFHADTDSSSCYSFKDEGGVLISNSPHHCSQINSSSKCLNDGDDDGDGYSMHKSMSPQHGNQSCLEAEEDSRTGKLTNGIHPSSAPLCENENETNGYRGDHFHEVPPSVHARLFETNVMSSNQSLTDTCYSVMGITKKDLINLPVEYMNSSFLSLTSIGSRYSYSKSKSKNEKSSSRILTLASNSKGERLELEAAADDKYLVRSSYTTLLTDPVFLLFCYGAFSFQLAYAIPTMFLPSYALHLGLNSSQAASTVSVIGICNMVGRFLAGLLSFLGVGSTRVYIAGTFVAGIASFFIPWCTTYITVILYAASHGFFLGVFFPLQSVLLVEILGIDQLPRSFGILCFCKSIACMLGPFLAGALYEETYDYRVPFLFNGGIILLATFLQVVMVTLRRTSCSWKPNK